MSSTQPALKAGRWNVSKAVQIAESEKEILRKVLNNEKYGSHNNLSKIIRNWDDSAVSLALIDIVGCFISLDPNVHAG